MFYFTTKKINIQNSKFSISRNTCYIRRNLGTEFVDITNSWLWNFPFFPKKTFKFSNITARARVAVKNSNYNKFVRFRHSFCSQFWLKVFSVLFNKTAIAAKVSGQNISCFLTSLTWHFIIHTQHMSLLHLQKKIWKGHFCRNTLSLCIFTIVDVCRG